MLSAQLSENLQNVNITILPVIIIPVTGICCLLFYNRLAAINSLIHAIGKDLRDLFIKPPAITQQQHTELVASLELEQTKLMRRSNLIRLAIVSCFFGLFAFVLSAVSIILGVLWGNSVVVTLILWVMGACSFAVGILTGAYEIKSPALASIMSQATLVENWVEEGSARK